jgi:hypothetical protein
LQQPPNERQANRQPHTSEPGPSPVPPFPLDPAAFFAGLAGSTASRTGSTPSLSATVQGSGELPFGDPSELLSHLRATFGTADTPGAAERSAGDATAGGPSASANSEEVFREFFRRISELHGHRQVPASSAQLDTLLDMHACAFGEASEGQEAELCSICLDETSAGERGIRMPCCSNRFHRACLLRWLSRESSRCPVCRQALPDEAAAATTQTTCDSDTMAAPEEQSLLGQSAAELKLRCGERGLDCSRCLEKRELVVLLLKERRAGNRPASTAGNRPDPAGWISSASMPLPAETHAAVQAAMQAAAAAFAPGAAATMGTTPQAANATPAATSTTATPAAQPAVPAAAVEGGGTGNTGSRPNSTGWISSGPMPVPAEIQAAVHAAMQAAFTSFVSGATSAAQVAHASPVPATSNTATTPAAQPVVVEPAAVEERSGSNTGAQIRESSAPQEDASSSKRQKTE